MQCPSCSAPEVDVQENNAPRQIKNLGGKRYYSSFNTRRYKCTACGHKFLTTETYHRSIQVRQPLPKPSSSQDGH